MHGYDATLLLAAAIKQAGSTDGVKMREALEEMKSPVDGVMKTYNKPFSKVDREGLTASDLVFIKWRDGKLVQYKDNITKSLTLADYIK